MKPVKLYSKDPCPYCVRAKNFFEQKGIPFEEIDMTNDMDALNALKEKTGWKTVPMIFIGDELIGGYTDLKALDDEGKLDQILKG